MPVRGKTVARILVVALALVMGSSIGQSQPATITVRLTCDVSLADLTIVPIPHGTVRLTSFFASPLDVYRYRVPTPTPSGSS